LSTWRFKSVNLSNPALKCGLAANFLIFVPIKFYFRMGSYYILSLVLMGVGMLVSGRLKSKFQQYAQVGLSSGLTGKQIAEKMLKDNGIFDVQVVSVAGFLSDHYNPENKTVNLSPDVYEGTSVSAAAVAAHECGHAVQHATSYSMLKMRSQMVPAVKIGTNLSNIVIMVGFGLMAASKFGATVFLIGIALFAISTVFSLITLPVEYDASNRALAWLNQARITNGQEHDMAEDALKWAARTYVVAAVSSIATLLYYVMMYLNARNRRNNN
jgi:uncharacterized protein